MAVYCQRLISVAILTWRENKFWIIEINALINFPPHSSYQSPVPRQMVRSMQVLLENAYMLFVTFVSHQLSTEAENSQKNSVLCSLLLSFTVLSPLVLGKYFQLSIKAGCSSGSHIHPKKKVKLYNNGEYLMHRYACALLILE